MSIEELENFLNSGLAAYELSREDLQHLVLQALELEDHPKGEKLFAIAMELEDKNLGEMFILAQGMAELLR